MKLTTDSPPQRALVQYGPRAVAYMLAIALPIITVELRLQWFPLQYGPWLVVFMLPISFCAAIGGFGPGLVATLLSSMLADYLLFPPTASLLLNKPENAIYLAVFTLVALWTCLLSHRARTANRLRLRDQDNLSLLAQLIDSTDNSVVATSLTGIISHWNTGAERIFGYTADQALGQSILMLFPPLAHASEQSIQARIAQGEKIPAYEARCKHRSGHSVEITTTVSAILNTHGNIIGISHISGDITQHKQLEQAKKQADAKFRALVEQSLIGVYIIQDEGIVYANQAFANIFDYPEPQQLIGRQAIDIVAAEDRVTVVGNILRRLNGLQSALSYRFNAICRGGEQIVVEVHGRHFMYEGRSAIIGSIIDVTEAQHLQEEMTRLVTEKTTQLQQRERELNTILDNMPGMISYYDPHLRHRFGNRMYCDWHDIQPAQLENLQLSQLINPKMYAALLPRLQATLQGNTHIFELTMESRSGKPGWDAQVHLIPNRHDGQVRGLFALVLDISPIKTAERAMCESEARFRQLFETAPVGIALYHQDGSCVMANLAQANLVGTTRDQLLTQNFYKIESWQHSGLLHIALKTLQTGQPQRYECKVTSTFGKQLEIDCEFTLPEVEGTRYLMMLAKDISPYRQAAQLMKQAMDAELDKNRIDLQYRQVIENMADGFFACDRQGRLLEVNDVYARLSGYSRSELLSMQISDLSIAESSAEVSKRLLRITTDGNARFETLQRHKNGSAWPSDISTSFSPADGGKIYAFVRDITEMKRAEDEIRRLAFYDSLTHLPNRQLLLDRLSQALVLCQRNRRYGALLFIDLDNFKLLNDTLGHDMGDHLLVAVAERLKSCVRAKDTVARLGGDEFIIMLEGLDNQRANAAIQIRAIASTVMEALNRPYQLQQTEYHNTPSIGVALFCEQETTVEELLKQADLAMYQAKAAGRNTLCFFDPVTQTAVENRTALETELRNALRQDHLILHYQPQIDRHGNTIGAEALVRWQHPEQGLIAPGEFISLAEESGLVYPLGLRVLELACQQLAYWQTQPTQAQLSLAVNVSARQFRHRDFVVQIRDLVTLYQVDPRNLKLELTESLLLHDVEESARKMDTLRAMGVKFSLDDFGTGYSSLAYLKALPLEQLKIDQSFVRDILSDPNDAAIVRAIIVMGHSLGLSIVAEGVETAEQWQFLMQEGCDIGQGYYFSPAVTGLDFDALEPHTHTHPVTLPVQPSRQYI